MSSFALSKESPYSFGLPLSSFALSKESPCSFGLPFVIFCVVERIALFLWIAFCHLSRCRKNHLVPSDCLLSSFAFSKESPYSFRLPLSSLALSKESPCSFGLPFVIFRIVERIALFLWIALSSFALSKESPYSFGLPFVIFRIVERIALFLWIAFVIFRIVERIALFLWIAFCHLSQCRKNRLIPLDYLCHLSHCRKNLLVPLDCLLSSFALSKESPCSFGLPFVIFRVVERIALFLWIAFCHLSRCRKNRLAPWDCLLSSFALSKESPCFFGLPFVIFRILERIAFLLWITFIIFRVVERITLFLWIAFVIFRVVERIALLLWIAFGHLSRCRKNRLTPLDCFLSSFALSKESPCSFGSPFDIFHVIERIALFLWIACVHLSHCRKSCLILRRKNCLIHLLRCQKSCLTLL